MKDKDSKKSVSPEDFFNAEDNSQKNKLRRQLIIRRVISGAVVAIGLFFIAHFFSDEKNYKLQNQLADLTFNLSGYDPGTTGTELSVSTNGKLYSAERISDSSYTITDIAMDSTQSASIVVRNANANMMIERPIDLKWQTYTVAVIPPSIKQSLYIRYNDGSVFTALQEKLTTELYSYTISSEQQSFSDSSRIIYYENDEKSRADSIAAIINQTLGMNVGTEFIEEKRIPPATPILFLNLTPLGPCSSIPVNSLSSSLNEIWKGKSSNRLVTLDLNQRVIYYSTGDKATYGTYRIDEICVSKSGSFKIITSANNQFKVFFLRNITTQSFELPLLACQDFVDTKDKASSVLENSCNLYDNMSLYYERKASLIYIPMDARSYSSQGKAGFKTVQARLTQNLKVQHTIFTNTFFSSSRNDIAARQNMIQQRVPIPETLLKLAGWKNSTFAGTPFDRDYILTAAGATGGDVPISDGKRRLQHRV